MATSGDEPRGTAASTVAPPTDPAVEAAPVTTPPRDDDKVAAAAARVARLEARLPVYPMRFVYLLVVVGAVDAADRTVVSAVFEDIRRTFGVSDAQLGLLTSAYAVVAALSALPFGWIADRWNRVWLIALGFVPWALGMFGTAVATSFAMLFIVRLLLGTIEATNGPATPSLLGDYYPVERRNHAFGIERLGNILGFTVGLAGGGILATAFGWRMAFVVFAVVGLVTGFVVLRVLPDPTRGLPDALLRARVRLHELRGTPTPSTSWPTTAASTEPADVTPSDVDYRTLPSGEALKRIARTPTLWILLVSGTVQQFSTSAIAVWTPTFFRRYHGLSAASAGSFVAFISIGSLIGIVAGARWGNRLAQRRHPRARVWLIASVMFASGVTFMIGYGAQSMGLATVGFLLGAFFIGVAIGPTFALLADVMVPHLRGKGFALVAVSRVVGQATAPILFGIVSDAYGLRAALLAMGPLALAGSVIMLGGRFTYARDMAFAQNESFRQHLLEEALGEAGADAEAEGEGEEFPSPRHPSTPSATPLRVLERGLARLSAPPWAAEPLSRE